MGASLAEMHSAACVRNLRKEYFFDPAIPGQEIYPEETVPKVSKDVCIRVFDYSIGYNKILETLNVHLYWLSYLRICNECFLAIRKMMLI